MLGWLFGKREEPAPEPIKATVVPTRPLRHPNIDPIRVRLESAAGGLVRETELPAFGERPDVLIWGQELDCFCPIDPPEGEPWPDPYPYRRVFRYVIAD
jgi:hypothetical protein